MIVHDGFLEFWLGQLTVRRRELAARLVTSFQTTFIFYASPSDFSIKSYGRLKFSTTNSSQLKIYHYFPSCEDSSIKYTLNQVTTQKFGSKFIFYLFLMNFTILSHLVCPSCILRPILCLLHYIHQRKYYLNQNYRRSNTPRLITNQPTRCIHKFIKNSKEY